jgi:phenylalanyl-tRNA synthetase beta chain
MQFSEHWLRTMVDPTMSSEELAHLLTMSGLEVESRDPVAPAFSGVVVAEVMSVARHPNADRLSVCEVNAGSGAPLKIVCGAPNVAAGMKVPCARIGAVLPGETPDKPFVIKAAKMRGEESQGMLCSARELGLSEDHAGLLALDASASVGQDLREFLNLDDSVFNLKLTPNRADCLSVLGVAREVAALTGAPVIAPDTGAVAATIEAKRPLGSIDARGCGRFTGRVIKNVNAKALTPDWMKHRLERAGQRSISALVDVTNYVMLELGRPLHVYDLDKLSGGIGVRFGTKGERLKLLNDQVVDIDESVLCITDDSGPIGLAGIMGGDSTKAELDTRHIYLESAFFFPDVIAGRARRFNFTSDASHRFERGVDFENNVAGIERATRLIIDICGGEPGAVEDRVNALPERPPVKMRVARARKVIGVAIDATEMAEIFVRLNFVFKREGAGDGESFVVTPPSYRFDIAIEEDLIEEIARVHGFERIPANPPLAPALMRAKAEGRRDAHDLRHLLAAREFTEVINYSFVDDAWEKDFTGGDPIRLRNPIAEQYSVMRGSLLGSLIANLRYNLNRKLDRVRVFEIARVYLRDPSAVDGPLGLAGIRQPVHLAALAFGPAKEEQWGSETRQVDFFDLKADVEALLLPNTARFEAATHIALHPGRSAAIVLDGKRIGWLGELHPRLQQKYELPRPPVLFELETEPLLEQSLPRYQVVSKFPPMIRDISVLVPETTPVQALLDAMNRVRPAAVKDLGLFDLYRGKGVAEGEKSLAFRVVIQDTSRTLTDEEADAIKAGLLQVLTAQFRVKLRGA